MRLGILETGKPGRSLAGFGDYPAMFRALLGERAHAYRVYDLTAGPLPEAVTDQDAWLITGSSAGVYDPEPWIAPLIGFLRACKGKVPLVGVCFGHQVMAEAFGGRVLKSDKGWGVGLHRYGVRQRRPWMDDISQIAAPAWHQDQVVEGPAAATVVAGNAFCPVGMLAYDDQPAISIQLHPEFDPDYVRAGLERRKMGLAEDEVLSAIAGLEAPNDNARLGDWISRFLHGASGRP